MPPAVSSAMRPRLGVTIAGDALQRALAVAVRRAAPRSRRRRPASRCRAARAPSRSRHRRLRRSGYAPRYALSTAGSLITVRACLPRSSGRRRARPRARKAHHRAHDVLDHDHRDAALVELEQDRQDVVDLGAGQPGHRLVGDQQRGRGGERAGQLELARSTWVRSAEPSSRAPGSPTSSRIAMASSRVAAAVARSGARTRAARRGSRAPTCCERARDLEAARDAEAHAPVRRQARDVLALEHHPPAIAGRRPEMQLIMVVLPEPFGPIRPTRSPSPSAG